MGERAWRFSLTRIIRLLDYKDFVTVYVKKFQYRWVNEQDLINLKMMHGANLTAGKRKISVIEENAFGSLFCKSLVEMPDVAEDVNLEWIILEGCVHLQKLNPSIRNVRKLVVLNDCKRLKYLPDLPSRTVFPSDSHLTGFERAGLIIFGCPELVEQCITKSFSWAIHILEATYQWRFPESIMPGSQIPSLFKNEFVNVDQEYLDKEYLTVDPPPIPHDNNLIGVLCCVIFRLYNEQIPMDFRRDHMWLHYKKVSMDERGIHPFLFSCKSTIITLLGYGDFVTADVKKIQYRWVNEQDLINLKMTHCANLTARKRKISVIEENG
ncbi:uncharacterized protein LOC111241588 [Vigna radiata var. radiata]|uniref:Uncharacterized protein LOC111241588 n=1 Tax=Vigna radiata var. radiata TaxID=3916 RepID=A0A3Q0EXT3_VIGRR|nr:uncharacterized protein LOC111241588 [Vigna radiata var. radiata]